jgi:CRP-like cAMP-binding protein
MPDLTETVRFLSRVPLFQSLKQRQLESLAKSLVPRQYVAGDEIVPQGEKGIGLFILVTGHAEAVRTDAEGSRVVLNAFGPTDFFGELALLDGGPHTASVVATEDTECLVLVYWEFIGKLRLDVDMVVTIMQEVVRRFHRALQIL